MIITLSSYEREGFVKIKTDRHYQFSLEECIKEGKGEIRPTIIDEIYSLMETYEYSSGYNSGSYRILETTRVDVVKKSLIFFNEDGLVCAVNVEIPLDDQGFILAGYLRGSILDSILSGRINQEVSHG